VFKDVDADDYEEIRRQRMNDDFIVDDEGYGYKDDKGGEIWEYEEDEGGRKKKQRKLNVS
jgi:hypothetical protein